MRGYIRLSMVVLAAFAAVAIATPAFALHRPGHKSGEQWKAHLLAEAPNATGAINSDIAFWGDKAFVGNYDGFRIFDISGPTPVLITDFRCHGPQNDLTVWDRNGDGEADLLFASVDRTLRSAPGMPNVDAGCKATAAEAVTAHDDPTGWEGVRVFDITDLRNPMLIASVYQDCGSHTHTQLPDPARNQLLLLNSSYPLRPGPTCGPVNGPRVGRDPLHGVIQVIEVPLNNPAAAREIAELPINYPDDPDNKFDPTEHALFGFNPLRACHDIAVFLPLGLVAGACAEQAQLWAINPATGLPDTANPLWVFDDNEDVDGPGGGDVAVDFWHSATFSWDGKVVNFIDESFGSGCPTVTPITNPATGETRDSDTGRMFFLDAATGAKLSHFFVNRPGPPTDPVQYCSAHLGNVVPANGRYLLVNAWYTAGVDVIDFTNPRNPREIAFSDHVGDNWSAYWYETGSSFVTGRMRIYGTHGVEDPAAGDGFEAFEAKTGSRRKGVDHLNPQTQEFMFP